MRVDVINLMAMAGNIFVININKEYLCKTVCVKIPDKIQNIILF